MQVNDTDKSTWQTVRFGDVVREAKETEQDPLAKGITRYVGLADLDPDSIQLKRWSEIADGETTFTRLFRKGQMLFGRRRAYQRKAAVAPFDGICSGDIIVMEAKPDKLLPELLPFLIHTDGFFDYAIQTSAGSLSPRTKWSHLAKYEFALPPLDEQRRIAEVLMTLEDVLHKYNECLIKTQHLQDLFFTTWYGKNNDQDSWVKVHLGDVCDIQSGQVDPTTEPYRNMIHIASDDIESETGRILEKNTATQDGITSGKYEFSSDAILYSKIRPNLKKVALPDFSGICSADMYPIYPKPCILREFLYHILLSREFTLYATGASTRSAIPKINRNQLTSYSFCLPPLDKQVEIVTKLNLLANNHRAIEIHLIRARTLKSSLLENLLTSVSK